jgi:mono/diheme cytochrome c family protein
MSRVRLFLYVATLLWIGALATAALDAAPQTPDTSSASIGAPLPANASGEDIYRNTCITCHAPDGKGSPRSVVGFDTPLPDFTDCAFATAEADSDWHAVVHEGGRIRGLSRHMPSFGDALTMDQIASAVDYVRHFCAEPAWPRGNLNFPRAFFTEKAFPENEAVLTTTFTGGDARSIGNEVVYERRLGPRNQFEAVLPLESLKGPDGWAQGIGDVAFAVRRTVFSDVRRGSIAAAGAEVALPTGSVDRGLGNGFGIVEPFAMFGQALPRRSFLQLHGGLEVPTDSTKAPKEAYLRTAFGTSFMADRGFGRLWTPQVELLMAHPFGEATEWDLVPQLQVTLSKIQHVRVAVGVRTPLTERDDRHTSFVTYLLWDWFDGGFTQFWK